MNRWSVSLLAASVTLSTSALASAQRIVPTPPDGPFVIAASVRVVPEGTSFRLVLQRAEGNLRYAGRIDARDKVEQQRRDACRYGHYTSAWQIVEYTASSTPRHKLSLKRSVASGDSRATFEFRTRADAETGLANIRQILRRACPAPTNALERALARGPWAGVMPGRKRIEAHDRAGDRFLYTLPWNTDEHAQRALDATACGRGRDRANWQATATARAPNGQAQWYAEVSGIGASSAVTLDAFFESADAARRAGGQAADMLRAACPTQESGSGMRGSDRTR